MSNPAPDTVVLVSDTHFRLEETAADSPRLARFLAFLEACRGVDSLVLLGDIFDFWFDYPHFRLRGYDDLLDALDALHRAGTRIEFVGGNHDIWAAAFLHRRYGSDPEGRPLHLEQGGRRIVLDHGDGLLARDYLYKTFRWIVRRRAGILLAKSLHPELLYAFSRWLSGTSRRATRHEAGEIERLARLYLARAPRDWDLKIIGHLHLPLQVRLGEQELAVLGCWLGGEEGYAVLRGGRVALCDFRRDPSPRAVTV